MEKTIVKIIENVSFEAKDLIGHNLLVKKNTKLTEKEFIIDENGKEHFYRNKSVQEKKENIEYPLTECSITDIKELRKSEKPIFLYKCNDKLYYTEITSRLHVYGLLAGMHKCASADTDCIRLSAESDENGGCKKVRDSHLKIENYPFIKSGYQIFNSSNNCLVVLECENFNGIDAKKARNETLAKYLAAKLFKDYKKTKLSNGNFDDDDGDDEDIFPRFGK